MLGYGDKGRVAMATRDGWLCRQGPGGAYRLVLESVGDVYRLGVGGVFVETLSRPPSQLDKFPMLWYIHCIYFIEEVSNENQNPEMG